MIVHLDFETRAPVNLRKTGAAKYAEHAEIMCAAWACDHDEPSLWLPGDPFPEALAQADQIVAHNAIFEYLIWRRDGVAQGWPAPPEIDNWIDTMAAACFYGLPRALGLAVRWARLPEKYAKDSRGKYLIQRLTKPVRLNKEECEKRGIPAGSKGYIEDPKLLQELYDYCKQDVVAERAFHHWCPPLPAAEQRIWTVTQKMNLRGIPMDRPFVHKAVDLVRGRLEAANDELEQITGGGVQTVGQTAKLKDWLGANGCKLPNIQKEVVEEALTREHSSQVLRVLEIRQMAGLASIKKYAAAKLMMCEGDKLLDYLIYHAAGTGRWSATGFQPQNIARPDIKPPEVARKIKELLGGTYDPATVLSDLANCLRGAIKAPRGHVLVGSDYDKIELVVLLWLAGAERQLDLIRDGEDPYKKMAMAYYGIPEDQVTPEQRQVGKSAVLGCGFQLGGKTFREYAANMGVTLSEDEAEALVKLYRRDHPEVVNFWYKLNDAAVWAVENPGKPVGCGRLWLRTRDHWLAMRLPSGREIMYYLPKVKMDTKPWGLVPTVHFIGTDTYTRQYGDTHSYGGKWVENATQGTARDIMAIGALNADKARLAPFLTVHDELVCCPPIGLFNDPRAMLDKALTTQPGWTEGIPITTESWMGRRYRK